MEGAEFVHRVVLGGLEELVVEVDSGEKLAGKERVGVGGVDALNEAGGSGGWSR